MPTTIRVAAGLVTGGCGRMLLVRKTGTSAFMQLGGKIDIGEQPINAFIRELREELGLTITRSAPAYLGRFSAAAAHEADATIEAELFQVAIVQEPRAGAEIDKSPGSIPTLLSTLNWHH
ncbi:NUDIX domain-containing protein [Devosia sp. 2618]|uniref:NUDIX hydrolase n=1 Tax=Devosia sp. 2618 TaxID=3156454 RepID=UPI003399607D